MTDTLRQTEAFSRRFHFDRAIVLCYLWFWISGAILLIKEKSNNVVRFHAWQSIIVFGSITVVILLLLLLPPVPYGIIYFSLMALWGVVIILGAYVWILQIVTSLIGRPYTLPLAGRIAAKLSGHYPVHSVANAAKQGAAHSGGNIESSKACVACGREIPHSAIFCPECGERQMHEVMSRMSDLGQAIAGRQAAEDKRLIDTAIRKTLNATVNAVTVIVEMRDPYTAGHQRRVTGLARAIAQYMHISREQVEGLNIAGQLHDIGKISVPSDILNKPGELSDGEMHMIRGHSQVSYDILKGIEFPWPVAEIVYQHHERLDGSGYPRGLKGGDILSEAKILAVADVVEAMVSHRPYRPALGIEKALDEIVTNKGILYDPDVVDVCLMLFTKKGFSFK